MAASDTTGGKPPKEAIIDTIYVTCFRISGIDNYIWIWYRKVHIIENYSFQNGWHICSHRYRFNNIMCLKTKEKDSHFSNSENNKRTIELLRCALF